MDAFFIEQCFEDASDGADGELEAVVSVEDDGDFFLSVCWVLQPDIEDELFFGFAPFCLVLVFSPFGGREDAFVDVLDDFLVSVVCCLGESADLGAEVFVEALRFPFFPLLDFLQIWFFDGADVFLLCPPFLHGCLDEVAAVLLQDDFALLQGDVFLSDYHDGFL